MYEKADHFVTRLNAGADFTVEEKEKAVTFTEEGARKAEAAEATEQARSAAVAAAQAETEAQALANNASRVDALREAWVQAKDAAAALHAQQAVGTNVSAAAAEADIRAGAAAHNSRQP